jgi:hypothetical protein
MRDTRSHLFFTHLAEEKVEPCNKVGSALRRTLPVVFEYVFQDRNAQQWRSTPQAFEVVSRGTVVLPSCTATVTAISSRKSKRSHPDGFISPIASDSCALAVINY